MCETYSIEDLATFTGLTDRTLRSYLKEGRLTGRKEDGAWRFTPEDLEKLFQDEGARQAVRANRNAIVYDFMLNGGGEDACCAVRDIPVERDGEEALRVRLLERVNREGGAVRFAYGYGEDRRGQGSARVILAGPTAAVQKILTEE
ncbi:MAG: helix-turn-helix domain-containing protein [Oscillospiraceae bacterium]|nr:helix-turn-helix domain-containing protein [Oscillospiraceae bacterium]